MEGVGGFVVALVALSFAFWLYIWLPGSMAVYRGRSPVGWVILTLVFSPFISIIALLVLGPTFELASEEARLSESVIDDDLRS